METRLLIPPHQDRIANLNPAVCGKGVADHAKDELRCDAASPAGGVHRERAYQAPIMGAGKKGNRVSGGGNGTDRRSAQLPRSGAASGCASDHIGERARAKPPGCLRLSCERTEQRADAAAANPSIIEEIVGGCLGYRRSAKCGRARILHQQPALQQHTQALGVERVGLPGGYPEKGVVRGAWQAEVAISKDV